MRVYKYTLETEAYRVLDWLPVDLNFESDFVKIENQTVTVKEGYSWDGCSPKFKIGNKIIGTPDGKNDECRFASLYHDVFYQYARELKKQGLIRLMVDYQFFLDLLLEEFRFSQLYYEAVRLFGFFTWNFRR